MGDHQKSPVKSRFIYFLFLVIFCSGCEELKNKGQTEVQSGENPSGFVARYRRDCPVYYDPKAMTLEFYADGKVKALFHPCNSSGPVWNTIEATIQINLTSSQLQLLNRVKVAAPTAVVQTQTDMDNYYYGTNHRTHFVLANGQLKLTADLILLDMGRTLHFVNSQDFDDFEALAYDTMVDAFDQYDAP